METDNLEKVQKAVKYAGFDNVFDQAIEANMKAQADKFQLSTTGRYGSSEVEYNLHFDKSEKNGQYYFNRYSATLKNENPAKEKSQTFFMNAVTGSREDTEEQKQMKRKAHGVTAKEAFNLLQGRAVYKTLLTKDKEAYNAWTQLDFSKQKENGNYEEKKFNDKYGFDLNKTLEKYPIKGLDNEEARTKLMQSLERGNRVQVTFQKDGAEEKMYVEARPEFKNLDVYDSKFIKQGIRAGAMQFSAPTSTVNNAESMERSAGKEATENADQKQNAKQTEQSDESVKKNSPRRRMKV